jgi:hypothetical protein
MLHHLVLCWIIAVEVCGHRMNVYVAGIALEAGLEVSAQGVNAHHCALTACVMRYCSTGEVSKTSEAFRVKRPIRYELLHPEVSTSV